MKDDDDLVKAYLNIINEQEGSGMTLDEMIKKLQEIRKKIGGSSKIFVDYIGGDEEHYEEDPEIDYFPETAEFAGKTFRGGRAVIKAKINRY